MLNLVEHEKSFISSGPGPTTYDYYGEDKSKRLIFAFLA